MEVSVIDSKEFIERLAHVAVHYLIVLDEPLVGDPLVPVSLLSRCLWDCYTDLLDQFPETKGEADFIIETVRDYKRGEISCEKAFQRIDESVKWTCSY